MSVNFNFLNFLAVQQKFSAKNIIQIRAQNSFQCCEEKHTTIFIQDPQGLGEGVEEKHHARSSESTSNEKILLVGRDEAESKTLEVCFCLLAQNKIIQYKICRGCVFVQDTRQN